MGFRFRKSINLGGGFKVNLSKSGIGYSWGTKGVRFSKTANGRNRTTLSIPGTGISHVSESTNKGKASAKNVQQTSLSYTGHKNTPNKPDNEGGSNMVWVKFVICLFFGFFGVHKFMEKKIGMGILYLFTVGLFGFGWLYDCGKYLVAAIKGTKFEAKTASVSVEPMAQVPSNSTCNHPIEPPTSDLRKLVKKTLLWAVTGLFALFALAFLLSGGVLAGLLAAAFVALVIPIDRWQNTLKTFIKGKIKAIVAVVLAILFFVAVPPAETTDAEVSTPSAVTATTTEAPTEAPTETLTEAPTEALTEALTEASTEAPTEAPTEASTEAPTEPVTEPIKDDGRDYVLNTNTKKFHYPSCSSADDIKAKNRKEFHGTRDEVIKKGYEPCGRCHP